MEDVMDVLHFSQAQGFTKKGLLDKESHKECFRTEPEILKDHGYEEWPDEDYSIPSKTDGSARCVCYVHPNGACVLQITSDNTLIFVDNYAELFALKAKLAPWMLLAYTLHRVGEVETDINMFEGGYDSKLERVIEKAIRLFTTRMG